MDTEKCRVLVRVVEAGNIRRVAEELGYTPSGVSRMMASLESELGFALLVRTHQGVAPTSACEQMLPYLRQAALAGQACVQAAAGVRGLEVGEVRIGTAYREYYPQLTRIMAAFHEAHPGIHLSIREAKSSPLAAEVEEGSLDFALISRREGAFAWHTLVEDEMAVVVPAGHELAGAEAYPLARFASDPYIDVSWGETSDNDIVFARLGITPHTVASVGVDSAGYAMVDAGLGIMLTNSLHARNLRSEASIALPCEPRVRFTFGVATPLTATPAAQAFADFALPRLAE